MAGKIWRVNSWSARWPKKRPTIRTNFSRCKSFWLFATTQRLDESNLYLSGGGYGRDRCGAENGIHITNSIGVTAAGLSAETAVVRRKGAEDRVSRCRWYAAD